MPRGHSCITSPSNSTPFVNTKSSFDGTSCPLTLVSSFTHCVIKLSVAIFSNFPPHVFSPPSVSKSSQLTSLQLKSPTKITLVFPLTSSFIVRIVSFNNSLYSYFPSLHVLVFGGIYATIILYFSPSFILISTARISAKPASHLTSVTLKICFVIINTPPPLPNFLSFLHVSYPHFSNLKSIFSSNLVSTIHITSGFFSFR